jgi:hypothetical protein
MRYTLTYLDPDRAQTVEVMVQAQSLIAADMAGDVAALWKLPDADRLQMIEMRYADGSIVAFENGPVRNKEPRKVADIRADFAAFPEYKLPPHRRDDLSS